jgi:hypothetical protein
MAHARKTDFVFRQNGRVHDSRGVRISGNNIGYTMFRGSVKGTSYPLHSPVSLHFPPVRHPVPSHFNWTLNVVNKVAPLRDKKAEVHFPVDAIIFSSTRRPGHYWHPHLPLHEALVTHFPGMKQAEGEFFFLHITELRKRKRLCMHDSGSLSSLSHYRRLRSIPGYCMGNFWRVRKIAKSDH